MDTTTQVLSILVLLIGLIATAVVPQFVRRRCNVLALRPQRAYEALDGLADVAVERGQTLLIGIGNTGIGGQSTALALAAQEIAYQTAARVAYGDREPVLSASDATALPLIFDAARRAYRRQNRRPARGVVRWMPAGPRSLVYAAGLTAYLSGDGAMGGVLVGRYGTELALVSEFTVRRGGTVIAASDQLDGQAVAFAFSKHALIGEEIFQAASYLTGGKLRRGETAALDVMRWLLITAIVAIAAYRLTNTGG